MQCESKPCPPGVGSGKQRIADKALTLSGDSLPAFTGPEALSSGITESLLMAWADGLDFEKLGWKGLNEEVLLRVFSLHQAEMDIRLHTPYIAQFKCSHLATRLLATLEEGTELKSRYAPLGNAEPMVVIVGHDGTLATLAGLLRIHWTAQGYQPDQVAPGGALIFERWRRDSDGRQVIRLRYTVQTLAQLREVRPLTAKNPPISAPIFIPGGSEAGPGFDCPLDRFDALVEGLIDPKFVTR
jgi:4-phytase / acid phosphatase